MTIKQKILTALKDGKSKHYVAIAKRIGEKSNSVLVILHRMADDGLVETPIITITKTKIGYYQLKKENN
jgi:Mn-dependent DtxR family transcriptional regulator